MGSLQHNLVGMYTIWYRDVLRFSRDRMRIIASLGQPLLFLFVFGAGLAPAISGFGGGNLDFTQFMFPGILSMTILFTAVFSAVSVVWDREFGFLKEVMVAPVSRYAIALGKIAGGSTIAMFQGAIILFLGPLIGVRMTVSQVVVLLGLMLLLATMMTSLGIMIAARQRTMEGFHMMMNFLLLPHVFPVGSVVSAAGHPGLDGGPGQDQPCNVWCRPAAPGRVARERAGPGPRLHFAASDCNGRGRDGPRRHCFSHPRRVAIQ